ncbi:hypothetical protein DLM86_18480 [Paenibacillus flagellatus]|uniref:Uncharacterized protein n=1 Tax=Paenibacillus flagellatus TaxID=2211139 RepID=A0A2V5KPB2_9BACL|nr:hypothetical protein DLM86_18480 [Paenibacillus flagellatus]
MSMGAILLVYGSDESIARIRSGYLDIVGDRWRLWQAKSLVGGAPAYRNRSSETTGTRAREALLRGRTKRLPPGFGAGARSADRDAIVRPSYRTAFGAPDQWPIRYRNDRRRRSVGARRGAGQKASGVEALYALPSRQ